MKKSACPIPSPTPKAGWEALKALLGQRSLLAALEAIHTYSVEGKAMDNRKLEIGLRARRELDICDVSHRQADMSQRARLIRGFGTATPRKNECHPQHDQN